MRWAFAVVAGIGAVATGAVIACASRPPAFPALLPACPRDALVDTSGRCVCQGERSLVLGACVTDDVADAFCGGAARPHGSSGRPGNRREEARGPCVFRACAAGEALDTDGGCVGVTSVVLTGPACKPRAADAADGASALIVTGARTTACVTPDATCPRGTTYASGACVAPPTCPAGALWNGRDCDAIVVSGPRGPLVRLGSWALDVLGHEGGPGTELLCRPAARSALAFKLRPGEHVELRLAIAVTVPQQDLSQAYATVHVQASGGASLPPDAERLMTEAVRTLVEPLKGLGGEASVGSVEVEVGCRLVN